MHACMGGWMAGWLDGWMDGWMSQKILARSRSVLPIII